MVKQPQQSSTGHEVSMEPLRERTRNWGRITEIEAKHVPVGFRDMAIISQLTGTIIWNTYDLVLHFLRQIRKFMKILDMPVSSDGPSSVKTSKSASTVKQRKRA